MERVVILGSPGAGKSTVARALGGRLGIPVIHLDALFYEPDWAPGEAEHFREKVRAAHEPERWISEGNFIALTSDLRFQPADTIVLLEQPLWRRTGRALLRGLRREAGRPDQALGCRDSFDLAQARDIRAFDTQDLPLIDAAIATHAPHARLIRLAGDAQARAFVENPDSVAR